MFNSNRPAKISMQQRSRKINTKCLVGDNEFFKKFHHLNRREVDCFGKF